MDQRTCENVESPSLQGLCKEIRDIIKGARDHEYLFCEDVSASIGFTIADSLDEDGEVENVAHR